MGFFKKIFKSVKKGFKSIGKGIKSAFKKFGKFMNKIGIVGQLALMFTPIGGMMAGMFSKLGSAAGGVFSKVTGALAQGGKLAQGAGKLLEAGAKFAKAGHSAFRTITDGIGSFVSEFSKTALKKIPGMEKIMPSLSSASDNFFTKSNVMVDGKMVSKSAWSTVQEKFVGNVDLVTGAFDKKISPPENAAGAYEEAVGKGTASTGASTGPVKDGYRFPDNATTAPKSISDIAGIDNSMEGLKARLTATPVSELGPVSAGTDASLLAQPQMSPVIVEGQGITSSQAINPVSGRPYVKSSIPKKIVEEKSYIEQLLGNAKTQVKEGFKDFKDKPMTTIFGEDPIATASDRFSGQLTQALAQRAAMGKPEGATVYYADIADFGQAYTAPYDSAEINDRAMQIQFGGADIFQQLPYGAGANVWQEQFRQSLGGRG